MVGNQNESFVSYLKLYKILFKKVSKSTRKRIKKV
jgi:hypothetical protein